jgi:hypothetical protein
LRPGDSRPLQHCLGANADERLAHRSAG